MEASQQQRLLKEHTAAISGIDLDQLGQNNRALQPGARTNMGFLKNLHTIVFDSQLKRDIHNPESPLRKALLIKSRGGRFAVQCAYMGSAIGVGYWLSIVTRQSPEDLGLVGKDGKPASKYYGDTAERFRERNKKTLTNLGLNQESTKPNES